MFFNFFLYITLFWIFKKGKIILLIEHNKQLREIHDIRVDIDFK